MPLRRETVRFWDLWVIAMSVIFLLITASTLVAGLFLFAFLWAARAGQFEDDRSPAVRILNENAPGEGEEREPQA